MQVTTEDGGRLNAFAKEPRMEVVEASSTRGPGTKLMMISGAVLVVALMAVTDAIS